MQEAWHPTVAAQLHEILNLESFSEWVQTKMLRHGEYHPPYAPLAMYLHDRGFTMHTALIDGSKVWVNGHAYTIPFPLYDAVVRTSPPTYSNLADRLDKVCGEWGGESAPVPQPGFSVELSGREHRDTRPGSVV